MLLIIASDKLTSGQVIMTHEIMNKGKLSEEHVFRVYRDVSGKGVIISDQLITSFVTDGIYARELKAHL